VFAAATLLAIVAASEAIVWMILTTPGPFALASIREGELRAAASVLGVREVSVLDYQDQQLERANPREAVASIVGHIRRVQPDVVVTFGPDDAYGHPDHKESFVGGDASRHTPLAMDAATLRNLGHRLVDQLAGFLESLSPGLHSPEASLRNNRR
jgi:LmbE family N-acetylglucosaminyl deacetylase